MNNAKIAQDSVEPETNNTFRLQEREKELVSLIENVRAILNSKEWSSLKEKVFDGEIHHLKQELMDESLKEEPKPFVLRYLAGRLFQAKKFDLEKMEVKYRVELTGIRKLLYGKTEINA